MQWGHLTIFGKKSGVLRAKGVGKPPISVISEDIELLYHNRQGRGTEARNLEVVVESRHEGFADSYISHPTDGEFT